MRTCHTIPTRLHIHPTSTNPVSYHDEDLMKESYIHMSILAFMCYEMQNKSDHSTHAHT